MKNILILSLFVIGFVACNKNQNAVKKLDGDWVAKKYEVTTNGKTSDYIEIGLVFTYHFDNCKLKKNEYCQITTTISNETSSDIDIQLYRVLDEGNVLEITNPINPGNSVVYKINKLTNHKVKLERTEGGSITNITLIKSS